MMRMFADLLKVELEFNDGYFRKSIMNIGTGMVIDQRIIITGKLKHIVLKVVEGYNFNDRRAFYFYTKKQMISIIFGPT